MLIYKYMSAADLELTLENNRIIFNRPVNFNDPFDQPKVLRDRFTDDEYDLWEQRYISPQEQADQVDEYWGKFAVSSFTRTFDNALMWAHYADKHKGAVIEIDAEHAGLMSTDLVIPVQFGSVIYLKKPNRFYRKNYRASAIDTVRISSGENRFEIDNYEQLQRLFLSKPLSWAYEEEVRAIWEPNATFWNDNGETWDGSWRKIGEGGSELFGKQMPPGSIKRVFIGLRYDELKRDSLYQRLGEQGCGVMVPLKLSDASYDIQFEQLGTGS
jgi:hypothetical protein